MSPYRRQLLFASGQLISLAEAAKYSPYSAEYLSLLARKGKLEAIKMSRDWFTTKEIILEYVKKQGQRQRRLFEKFQATEQKVTARANTFISSRQPNWSTAVSPVNRLSDASTGGDNSGPRFLPGSGSNTGRNTGSGYSPYNQSSGQAKMQGPGQAGFLNLKVLVGVFFAAVVVTEMLFCGRFLFAATAGMTAQNWRQAGIPNPVASTLSEIGYAQARYNLEFDRSVSAFGSVAQALMTTGNSWQGFGSFYAQGFGNLWQAQTRSAVQMFQQTGIAVNWLNTSFTHVQQKIVDGGIAMADNYSAWLGRSFNNTIATGQQLALTVSGTKNPINSQLALLGQPFLVDVPQYNLLNNNHSGKTTAAKLALNKSLRRGSVLGASITKQSAKATPKITKQIKLLSPATPAASVIAAPLSRSPKQQNVLASLFQNFVAGWKNFFGFYQPSFAKLWQIQVASLKQQGDQLTGLAKSSQQIFADIQSGLGDEYLTTQNSIGEQKNQLVALGGNIEQFCNQQLLALGNGGMRFFDKTTEVEVTLIAKTQDGINQVGDSFAALGNNYNQTMLAIGQAGMASLDKYSVWEGRQAGRAEAVAQNVQVAFANFYAHASDVGVALAEPVQSFYAKANDKLVALGQLMIGPQEESFLADMTHEKMLAIKAATKGNTIAIAPTAKSIKASTKTADLSAKALATADKSANYNPNSGQVLAAHTTIISKPAPPVVTLNQQIKDILYGYIQQGLFGFNASNYAPDGIMHVGITQPVGGSASGENYNGQVFVGPNGGVQNSNGQTTSVIGGNPIVTYVPAAPQYNFSGTTLAGFGQLSAQSFSSGDILASGNLTVGGATQLNGLTVSGSSNVNNLNVSGTTNLSGTTTIASLNVTSLNPGLTTGSVAFQGTGGLSQDNGNFFYDATNHRLGLGTTTPGQLLTVAGNAQITGLASAQSLTVAGSSTLATTTISNLSLTQALSPIYGGLGFNASGIAKGGILSGTGSGTFGIQTVGSNGLCLVASSTAVSGLDWENCAQASGAILSLNGQSQATQTFATGSDANITLTISSVNGVHTFTPGFTGQLSVSRGGTGQSTLTQNALLLGNGASGIATSTLGTNGQILVGVTNSAPTFVTMSGNASINNSGALTLSSVNSNIGTFGANNQTLTATVNAKGLITSISTSTISLDASQINSGVLAVNRGGTGQSILTAGSVLYGNGTNGVATSSNFTFSGNLLNINGAVNASTSLITSATTTNFAVSSLNQALPVRSTSAGTLFNGAINLNSGSSDISGTLAYGSGGTGQTAFTNGNVIYAGASSLQGSSNYTFNGTILNLNGTFNASTSVISTLTAANLNASSTILTNATTTGQFYTLGSTYLATNGGYVGIGTVGPATKLHVLSGINTNNISTPTIAIGSDRSDYSASIDSVRGSASTYLGLAFSTTNNAAASEVMRIQPNGNVGIGTTSPDSLLHVYGTGQAINVGTGASTKTYISFSGDRAELGFDGNNTYFKGSSGKAVIGYSNGSANAFFCFIRYF